MVVVGTVAMAMAAVGTVAARESQAEVEAVKSESLRNPCRSTGTNFQSDEEYHTYP